MEYYSPIKKNEIMPFVATRMGLEIEGSQRKTNRWYCLYMESKKVVQMNLLTKQKQSQMSKKQTDGYQRRDEKEKPGDWYTDIR